MKLKLIKKLWCKHQINKLLEEEIINDQRYLALECLECETLHYKSYELEGYYENS